MWFPSVLQDELKRRPLFLEEIANSIMRAPHRAWVHQRECAEEPKRLFEEKVLGYCDRWRCLSFVGVGTRHGHPIGPYASFSVEPTWGVAYLEDFVDGDTLPLESFPSSWHNNALCFFSSMLFRRFDTLEALVLPKALPAFYCEGLEQKLQKDGRSKVIPC